MTFDLPLIFLLMIMVVAFLYGSVGHGGASGYLALFALFGIHDPAVVPVVLVLNMLVSASGFYNFRKTGHFNAKLFFLFVVTSVPFAFAGGMLEISDALFKMILGIILVILSLRIFISLPQKDQSTPLFLKSKYWLAPALGAVIGLLSGMIGVGGGIFLSPLIILLGWENVRTTAGISSLFILLNSISAFTGHYSRGNIHWEWILLLGVLVLGAGFLGSRISTTALPSKTIEMLLSGVVAIAGVKLLIS